MTYMLDTNICIYAMNEKPIEVYNRLLEYSKREICISVITLAELKYGIYKSNAIEKNTNNLERLLDKYSIIPFDDRCAAEYGKICAYLQKAGTPIGTMDMLIAAHAKTLGYTLVTNNMREFERVPDLKVENWAAAVNS